MPIFYSCVARGTSIIVQAGPPKKYKKIVIALLGRVEKNEQKSYVYDGNKYNYSHTNGITFLCVTNKEHKSRVCFAFLKQVEQEFEPSEGTSYRSQLEEHMKTYSDAANVDKVTRVQNKIDEVKDVMLENIDHILERGEKLEDLAVKTNELDASAAQFQQSAHEVKKAMWWKNMKMWILLIVVVLVVILIILFIACGIDFHKCIHKNTTPTLVPTTSPPTLQPTTLQPTTPAPTVASPT